MQPSHTNKDRAHARLTRAKPSLVAGERGKQVG